MLTEPQNRDAQRKCAGLDSKQADAIFFPGSGGKVNKSRQFCSDCPVKDLCLNEALDFGLEGFWAGTTDKEREGMRRFRTSVRNLGLELFLPPEIPKKRRVYRKVVRTAVVIHAAYLDELNPSDEEVLTAG